MPADTAISEDVVFIGGGTMGAPMIRNLSRAGFRVRAFDIVPAVLDGLRRDGIETIDSLLGGRQDAGITITMLPDTPDVSRVLTGPGGLIETLPAGSLVIDMSTIAASAVLQMSESLRTRGIGLLDAPVSGGVAGAVNGALSIMVGGSETDFRRAEPVLKGMGKRILHAGPAGMGQVFKMCNQLMAASHIQAMCEAFALGRAHGADLETLRNALAGGAAASWMLENLGPQVIAKDARAGFRIDLQLKDLKLALDATFEKGVPLPGLALASALYLEARAHGEGVNGNQALFCTFDRMSNQAGIVTSGE
jgi:2-hydroxy-3-oxopropionate reductase